MKPLYSQTEFDNAKSREPLPLECEYCGKVFYKLKHHIQQKLSNHTRKELYLFCSHECSAEFKRKTVITKQCTYCGKDIKGPPSRFKTENVFCSHKCCGAFVNPIVGLRRQEPPHECLNCGKLIYSRNKYCDRKCYNDAKQKNTVSEWLSTGITHPKSHNIWIKRYLLEEQKEQCAICGQPILWNGKKLVLILDHIDGNSMNNERSNLRLVCPNCDSQLPTYKSKNKGSGRHYRRKRYAEGKSY